MPTYAELQERIAALEAQAAMHKAQERAEALAAIRALMEQHGIDPSDLSTPQRRRRQTSTA